MVHRKARRAARRARRKAPLLIRAALAVPVGIGNLITKVFFRKTKRRTTTKELARTTGGRVLGGAILGVGGALAAAVSGVPATIGGLKSIGASFIPKTTLGKGLALLTVGAAASSPTVAKAIFETPRIAVEKGEALGEKIEGLPEEVKKGKTVLELAGAALLGIGAGVAGTQIPKLFQGSPDSQAIAATPIQEVAAPLPVTPQTEVITPETATTKPRKTRRKVSPVRVNQRVSIIVQQNKKLLNKGIIVT